MVKIEYWKELYDFRKIVEDILGQRSLEKLFGPPDIVTQQTDQSSDWHKKWYSSDISSFLKKYTSFIIRDIYPITQLMWGRKEGLLYQTKPTIRFHYPNNLAVGEYHRDRDYSHNPAEINVFLPITNAYDTNTFWLEIPGMQEEDDFYDQFQSVDASYGQFVLFDGANLEHGNEINETPDTRVSFDFRILQPSKHIPGKFSKAQHKAMEIGEYWTKL